MIVRLVPWQPLAEPICYFARGRVGIGGPRQGVHRAYFFRLAWLLVAVFRRCDTL